MEIWRIVQKLGYLYKFNSARELNDIVSENFQYISDFEDIPPLDFDRYKEHLEKSLQNFEYKYPEIIERRYCKKLIETVLRDQKCRAPFQEPRLLQCEIENNKICKMHLCSPDNQRIPDNIQDILLESCKKNDFNAAKEAIANGAYAGMCSDRDRSCLDYAAQSGSVELCRLLVEDEAEYIYGTGWQAVFFAVENPDIEVLKYLLTLNPKLDTVCEFTEEEIPMTVLDYAEFLNNHAAIKILRELHAPTFQELKDWCFNEAKLSIRISEKYFYDDDMSITGVGEKVNEYTGLHLGASKMCLWMELENCCDFIIPFFREYFTKPFEAYLEDNLVTFENAEKALAAICTFCKLLMDDFDDPFVQTILEKAYLSMNIEWEERSSTMSFYFSEADRKQLWKAKRQYLIDFYQEFCRKFETMLADAKEAGDRYISFVGP